MANRDNYLFALSFIAKDESGLALVSAPNASTAFQILKNSGRYNYGPEFYILIRSRNLGLYTCRCAELLLESYTNAEVAYEKFVSIADSFVGPAGEPAGFGSVVATVDDSTGVPYVEVSVSGPDTAKNFSFSFHNLKGADGIDAAVVPGEGQKSAQQRESGAVASGEGAFAEGDGVASGAYSHAEGRGTEATHNEGEHAEGKWNKSDQNTISSIGIGTSANDRKNAVEVMKDGKVFVKGVGGFDGTNPGNADDLASAIENAGSGDAVLYTPQVLTDSQKNQARENIETVGATVVSSITPAEDYVSQELMNLLAVAPTMKVTWKVVNGTPRIYDKKIYVNHPLMNYEGAEIVLLSYARKKGARSKSPSEYNKGYSIATPWKDTSDYFTFSEETDMNDLATFMESFRGWDDNEGAWVMPIRKTHFGIALRIPNPSYNGPETPNKNNTYKGVPESIWSAVLKVGIHLTYEGSLDRRFWGIGIK